MVQVTTAEVDSQVVTSGAIRRRSFASILSTIIFSSLVGLLVIAVIPYATSQPWWRALFVCAVFTLAIPWLIEGFITGDWFRDSWSLVLPLITLAIFALLQTLPVRDPLGTVAGISLPARTTVSADPYQTRFFVFELLALTIAGVLFFRTGSSERRMRITINVVIAVAVACAIFGILRQTTHPSVLFGLPFLPPWTGYGQFINRNHFAFLMEMSLGLILGLVLGGGVKREQSLIYFGGLLVIWTGLVLCGSRGGLIAMLAQVVIAALLFGSVVRKKYLKDSQLKLVRIANSLALRALLLGVLIVGLVVGTIWIGGDRLAMRIDQTREQITTEDTSRYGVSRQEIWRASWQLFSAHPFLGVGMGAYWAAVPTVHNASGAMTPREAHNDYLELLASGGVVGTLIGIWFAVVVCRRTRENLRSPNRFRRAACYAAAIGIAGVAVHSLLDFGLHMMANALVFTTLIVIATSKPHWANEPSRLYD